MCDNINMVMFKIKCAVIGCGKRVNITDSFETTYDEVNIRIHCCSTCWNKFFSMTGSRIQYKNKSKTP